MRSQSQSAASPSKILKGKVGTAKKDDVNDVKGVKGVEDQASGGIKEEVKEDIKNNASADETSETSEGRVVEEDEEMDDGSDELSEQAEEEEEQEEPDAEEGEYNADEGNEEEGSDAEDDDGQENDNSDGHDSARDRQSSRPPPIAPIHDRKPDLSDTKPSSTKRNLPHVPGPFNKLADDVILEIGHQLLAEEAYASTVALLGMSKRTKVVLRPLMKRTKNKVVLDLDDLR